MDQSRDFFAKLRKLAVTLERETTKLQSAFENHNSDDDDDENSERTAKGMRAYHELNCEVLITKEQIQDDVEQQKTNLDEVSRFIKDCDVLQLKLSKDINVIKSHWEKYGYQAPKTEGIANDANSLSTKEEAVTDDENQSPDQAEGPHDDTEEDLSPEKPPAAPVDPMRTPQLSDFGLSEVQLKKALGGEGWCEEVPQMPKIVLPHLALNTPPTPTMAITPKRSLRMEEDELLTPKMYNFGISEHTMLLNNDFTINLRLKSLEKTKKLQQNVEAPIKPMIENLQENDDLESPEPPLFCTPGLKIKKTCPAVGSSSESPTCAAKLPSTPDIPSFQTPYVNRLLSTKKSERKAKPIKIESDDDSKVSSPPTSPPSDSVASENSWKCHVPTLRTADAMECEMPAMPNLESNLGNSLQIKSAQMRKTISDRDRPVVKALELDGPSQDFSLRTPCVRREYEEPSTPEMPDLSSVTQDICKLVSQTQTKRLATAEKITREKENTSPPKRSDSLSWVSEQEFQCLPSYLKQMTLNSLNQAVDNINRSVAKCKRDKTEFHIEELKRMIEFGAKTPLYILCLSELKRMDQIRGSRTTAVYKLKTQP